MSTTPTRFAGVPVFFLEPTDSVRVSLRRYSTEGKRCERREGHYHDASLVIIPEAPAAAWGAGPDTTGAAYPPESESSPISREDPRWPVDCQTCGEPFQSDDEWQVNADRLYRGAPDGLLYTLRDAPVGAMWDMNWLHGMPLYCGPDGIALCVATPGGEWYVDSQASNCTRPSDLSHKCWVRHGDPRDPQGVRTGRPLHVDKAGDTCAAGAGSIQAGSFHGFLHHGWLTNA
ncbi:MAG: hypothetical protein AB1941_09965 [Gemmatimonadota bacterium]